MYILCLCKTTLKLGIIGRSQPEWKFYGNNGIISCLILIHKELHTMEQKQMQLWHSIIQGTVDTKDEWPQSFAGLCTRQDRWLNINCHGWNQSNSVNWSGSCNNYPWPFKQNDYNFKSSNLLHNNHIYLLSFWGFV